MSLKDKNIEELFRSELEDFEMPVDQSVWSNIANGLTQSAVTTTAATSTTTWLTYLGISAAAVTIGVVATLAYINSNNTTQNTQQNTLPSNQLTLNTQKEVINTVMTPPAKIETEDATFVKEIAQPTIVVNDPVIPKEEQKATPKKVIVAPVPQVADNTTESETYKKPSNSWVDTWLSTASTNSNTESTTTNNNNKDQSEVASNITTPTVFPMIVEVEKNEIIASIVAAPVGGYAPLEVSFAQQSETGKVSWDFGDESSNSTETNPVHVFEKYGTYTVTLTIENEEGDVVTDTREIEVLASSAITNIPNVITPNYDGNNDLLTIETKNIETFQVQIQDKKGRLIFESNDKDNSWDGKNKYDEFVPAGNYVLILVAVGVDGKIYKQTGSVTVKY